MSYNAKDVIAVLVHLKGAGKDEISKLAAILGCSTNTIHNALYKKWRPNADKLVRAAIADGRIDPAGVPLKVQTGKGRKRAAGDDADGEGDVKKGRATKKAKKGAGVETEGEVEVKREVKDE